MTAKRFEQFESEVRRLLSLSSFEVQSERLLGHKKVDLFMTESRFGSTRRIAVECKQLSRRLTKDQLVQIYSDYRPLYDSNQIDELLLVTEEGITAGAQALVQETRALSHLTRQDLYASILDFSSYVAGLTSQYEQAGLPSYYIRPLTSDGSDLEDYILTWVTQDNSKPIAILGSYGSGKTTLAKRLSYVLGSQTVSSSTGRMPVYVPLGEISSEQSLEGLLGKLFTARTPVPNYSFDLFMGLTKAGRFVLILDGFDEMKHTLTWESFRYNFGQLNRLVVGRSKVILLGRPTAFLNDSEYKQALRGLRSVGKLLIRDPDWPEYLEHYLQPFTPSQAREFLDKYIDFRSDTVEARNELRESQKDIAADVNYLVENSDLSTRPVQLAMLAEVLPSFKGDIRTLSEATLYSYFIDIMIEREQSKLARKRFTTQERRDFARRLALFLWEDRSEMSITAEAIPDAILQNYLRADDDVEAVRRDLVAACFLERKLGESLYFPHRSFQEFLVAESILLMLGEKELSLERADNILTLEVADFLEGLVTRADLERWSRSLNQYRGRLSTQFGRILLSADTAFDFIEAQVKRTRCPWYPLLLALGAYENRFNEVAASRAHRRIKEKMAEESGRYNLVAFISMLLTSNTRVSQTEAVRLLVKTKRYSGPEAERDERIEPTLARLVSSIEVNRADRVLEMHSFYSGLFVELESYCLFEEWRHERDGNELIERLPGTIHFTDAGDIITLQQRYPGPRQW